MPSTKATLTALEQSLAEEIAEKLETHFMSQDGVVALFENEDEPYPNWSVELYIEGNKTNELQSKVKSALEDYHQKDTANIELLDDVDWVTESLQGLDAVRVGRFVVHGIHAKDAVKTTDIGIRVEAGCAFGTGHHGTTAGCLEAIAGHLKSNKPKNILDLGTGSGVLAIAIAKQTKQPVLASDIDPIATRICAENAKLNNVSPHIRSITAHGFSHPNIAKKKPYDLIIANILAGPLIDLAPMMAQHLSPNGVCILSGLLIRQEQAVRAAYRQQGLFLSRTLHRNGWATLTLTFP